MRLSLLFLLTLLCVGRIVADEPANPSASFLSSLPAAGLQLKWSFATGGVVRLTATNPAPEHKEITVPAGLICANGAGVRVISLRRAVIAIPGGATAEAELPAALLGRTESVDGICEPMAQRDLRVDRLLRFLENHADMPRGTSQLAVLCLTENIGLAGWEEFLRRERKEERPTLTPAEIVQAVDALGVLREIAPEQNFALASDPELKLRALRNPWCRAKAMQLYGLALPEIAPGQAPDLGQLLHTKANDNCPVCRLRQGPPGGAGEL